MGNIEVHHGDCIEVMRTIPDSSVDSIVTDPPYGLGFMGKAWDALPPGEAWAADRYRETIERMRKHHGIEEDA